MVCKADMKIGKLIIGPSLSFTISCNVRTLKNGLRRSNEVIYTPYTKKPYMPTVFPKGVWKITGVNWQKNSNNESLFSYNTYGPCKILTDAWQWVNIWELDSEEDYFRETDEVTRDTCYWLHYSTSSTTLGCLRFYYEQDAETFGRMTEKELSTGNPCSLEVVW